MRGRPLPELSSTWWSMADGSEQLQAPRDAVAAEPASVPDIGVPGTGSTTDAGLSLKELERRHIEQVVADSETLVEAAARLGIDTATLWRKRKRYGMK